MQVQKCVYAMTNLTLEYPPFFDRHTFALIFSVVHVARSLVFCVLFCRLLFVPLFFFLWPLFVHRFAASDYLVSSNFS